MTENKALVKRDLSSEKIINSFGLAVRALYDDTWNVIMLAKEVKKQELWKNNYDSFDQFLADYKLKPSTINSYIQMSERLLNRGVKADEMVKIPPGAAMLISTKPDPEKYIDLAKTGSWTDVRKQIAVDSGKTEREAEEECEATKACPFWKDCARYRSRNVKEPDGKPFVNRLKKK